MVQTKILKIRQELSKANLKKSGKNKHLNFEYYELADFMPTFIKVAQENGLYTEFNVFSDKATLVVIDCEDKTSVTFETTIADASVRGAAPVQNLGAMHTYLKRYLYVNLLELSDGDMLDPNMDGKVTTDTKQLIKPQTPKVETPVTITPTITPTQVVLIEKALNGDVEKEKTILDFYKVKGIEDLTIQQATQVLGRLNKNAN